MANEESGCLDPLYGRKSTLLYTGTIKTWRNHMCTDHYRLRFAKRGSSRLFCDLWSLSLKGGFPVPSEDTPCPKMESGNGTNPGKAACKDSAP